LRVRNNLVGCGSFIKKLNSNQAFRRRTPASLRLNGEAVFLESLVHQFLIKRRRQLAGG
jgi:hypothetical protein